jgi:hypothetical protein|tara:strand:- start:529 stop:702 length:174 start_codon:yes stop_codon:yes gene_type:complete
MDLQILSGSFADTTITVVPVSEKGQKFLGFATASVEIPKSQLQQSCEIAAAHGLRMG